MFGLTFEKLIVIAVIAAFLIGPERLPGMVERLRAVLVQLRRWMDGAKDRVREEVGPEFDEIDWRTLDPRRYDPRQIIRDALAEDAAPTNPVPRAQVRLGQQPGEQKDDS